MLLLSHVSGLTADHLRPLAWPRSRLQAAAVAFGENIAIPEIVAIGGQSDGKSSLLEAFLGVRQPQQAACIWIAFQQVLARPGLAP